jgi:hypothetical protein
MADPRDAALTAQLAHKKLGCLSEIDALFVNAPDDLGVGEHVAVPSLKVPDGRRARQLSALFMLLPYLILIRTACRHALVKVLAWPSAAACWGEERGLT